VAAEPDRNELVSIFNNNPPGGDFVHAIYEDVKRSDGTISARKVVAEYRAPGRDFSNVPRWVADLWKKQFPGVIRDGAEVSRGGRAAPVANERVSALEGENAELKKRLDSLEALIAELQGAPGGAPSKT
jgi:hypothetical protein